MLLVKHINDRAAGLGVQFEWSICPTCSPVLHHAHGGMDLSTRDHVIWYYFLAIEVVYSRRALAPPPAASNIKSGLFHLPCKSHIAPCIPSVKPTPDDWLDVVETGDPPDSPKDARLEDQRALGVPAVLNGTYPEVRQQLKKTMYPTAVGEVIQLQVAGSIPEVEPLPLGILSSANPTVEVGAIILMDGVAVDTAKLTFGVCQPLQPWVLRP